MFGRCAFLLLCLGALMAAGCATAPRGPAAAAPYRDTLVVPNLRIGSAVIGMSSEQMVQWLGRPDRTVGSGDGAYLYEREGLQIAFEAGRAYQLAVTRPGYATADGVGVGTGELELEARWGRPTRIKDLTRCLDPACSATTVERVQYCYANGLQAELDAQRSVVAQLQVRAGGCR